MQIKKKILVPFWERNLVIIKQHLEVIASSPQEAKELIKNNPELINKSQKRFVAHDEDFEWTSNENIIFSENPEEYESENIDLVVKFSVNAFRIAQIGQNGLYELAQNALCDLDICDIEIKKMSLMPIVIDDDEVVYQATIIEYIEGN